MYLPHVPPNPAFERTPIGGAVLGVCLVGAAQLARWAAIMTMNTHHYFLVTLFVAAIVFGGCSKEEPKMSSENTSGYQQVALEFTKSLAAREYPKAYAMTSQECRKRTTVEQLRAAFENIVPSDWGQIGPIEVGQTMTSWPGKRPDDVGWAYVSIGGDVYSEAITVVVTSEDGESKIREVEFGRP
jgi:hypothetical protein